MRKCGVRGAGSDVAGFHHYKMTWKQLDAKSLVVICTDERVVLPSL